MRSHHFLLTTFLVFSLCLFPILAAAATPHIYDVPHVGPPGSQTSLVGNGFDPNATLDIYLDSTNVGLVDTDKDGSFGMALRAPTIRQNGLTVQIPKDAVPGQHWITAVERITQLQAQVQFVVSTDWPQFHFDAQHTGFNPYENVLSPVTVGNLVVDWEYTVGFWFESSPAVANGGVYVGSADGYLSALNAQTGALLWRYKVADCCIYSSPAVANGVVYVGGYNNHDQPNGLYALNAATGAFLWTYTPVWGGVVSSPVVANGIVYVGADDGNLYALNASTGSLLWKYPTGSNDSSPAVADGVVYVGSTDGPDGALYALDTGTGRLLWKYAMVDNQIQTTPAVVNGVVYVAFYDGHLCALDAATGARIWGYFTPGAVFQSSPAVANGVVYLATQQLPDSTRLYALDASTGALLWAYPISGVSSVTSSPAIANGVLYIGIPDGYLYALNATTGEFLAKYAAGPISSSPAVVNGMVYVGSGLGFYAFGLPNQQMSEKFSLPERPDPARLTPNWSPTLRK